MPYTFQCVNATYINAYAFPGGSIAATRGILLKLDNEAQLAALLGHELGHVNARHTAEQVSKGQLSSLLVSGLAIAAGTQGSVLGEMTQQLGMLGQGLFLSKYSRDNEREADFLGNLYMVKAGYGSRGFSGLMEMLDSLHKEKPNSAQMLFSTHPMSTERLSAAVQREKTAYGHTKDFPLHRERYMDNTALLRSQRQVIELVQAGEKHMAQKAYDQAETALKTAVQKSENDYTAQVLMARCLMLRKKPEQAVHHASAAKKIYPSEVQGHYISAMVNLELKKFGDAYTDFVDTDRLLPGNPQLTFYKGFCRDKNGDQDPAAKEYMAYLKMIDYQPNDYSRYAYNRLKEMGYAK
jgi:predicted Zn-dependent protease